MSAGLGEFAHEIQLMMYGLGDCHLPLYESVQLVEEVLHQQMNSLVLQCAEQTTRRGAKEIGHQDLLFLMRKDKVKLSRLMKYIDVMDLKSSAISCVTKLTQLDPEDLVNSVDGGKSKRMKACLDFLQSIDQTGELVCLASNETIDEVKLERLKRIDKVATSMDGEQYLEYSEARQATFCKRNIERFYKWLFNDDLTDLRPTQFALEIFCYLAYETVAQIVDLSLLVKQDAKSDTLERLQPPIVRNTDYPSIQMSSKKNSVSSPSNMEVKANMTQNFVHSHIEPEDIREAIRRYFHCHGPFLCFAKLQEPTSEMKRKLLCC